MLPKTITSADEVAESLKPFFDPKLLPTDTLHDVAHAVNIVNSQSPLALGDFLTALNRRNSEMKPITAKKEPPIYTSQELGTATRKDLIDALGIEEMDMLRDAFIRLDCDGDGFITLADTVKAVSAVIGKRFGVFEPYLRAIFATADQDGDKKLDLKEFLRSFSEGPGVLPQEVVSECVAAVRVRLNDEEILVLQDAFNRMDADCDGKLNANELKASIVKAMGPSFPDLTDAAFDDIVSIVIREADRDLDGALNLSEFLRSFHEDQGVLPVQLIELYSVARKSNVPPTVGQATGGPTDEAAVGPLAAVSDAIAPENKAEKATTTSVAAQGAAESSSVGDTHDGGEITRDVANSANTSPSKLAADRAVSNSGTWSALEQLDSETAAQFHAALLHLSTDAGSAEFASEAATLTMLESALRRACVREQLISELASFVVAQGHRRPSDNAVSIRDFARKFSLRHRRSVPSVEASPKHSDSGVAPISSQPADHGGQYLARTSSMTGETVEVLDLSATDGKTALNAASVSAEVFAVAAEQKLFQRIFDQFDTDHDGFLVPADLEPTQRTMIRTLRPDWTGDTATEVVASLFAAADDDKDGKLSYGEFYESFQTGYGVLPPEYIRELSQRFALDLDSFKQIDVYNALCDADSAHNNRFLSPNELSAALFAHLEKPLDSDMNSIAGVVELVQRNAKSSPNSGCLHITPFLEFLRQSFGHQQATNTPNLETDGTVANTGTQKNAEPPAPITVPLFDLRFILDVLRTLEQANAAESFAMIKSKLVVAIEPLYPDEASDLRDRIATNCALGAFYAREHGTEGCTMFSAVLDAPAGPAATLYLNVLSDTERTEKAKQDFEAADERTKRLIAAALVECDLLRNGEIDFVALTRRVCNEFPGPLSTRQNFAATLRGAGVQTSEHVLSISAFAAPVVFDHFVMPAGVVPALMTRRLNHREKFEIRQAVSSLRGTAQPHDHEELRTRVAASLSRASFAYEGHNFSTVVSGIVNSFTAANLPLTQFCDMFDSDRVVLLLPLLSAQYRRGIAVRLCLSGLSMAACKLLVRTILLIDTNRDGKISVDNLSSAFLSAASGIVTLERAKSTVEQLTLMVEEDTQYDGYVQLSDVLEQLVEAFPLPYPIEMTTVVGKFPAPFRSGRDDELLAAIKRGLDSVPSHAHIDKEALEELLRKATNTDNLLEAPAWVGTIVGLFSRIAFDPELSLIAAGDVAKASEVFHDSIAVAINALPPHLTNRAISVALPAAQQRDLACAFLLADSNRDGFLDFSEFSPVISRLCQRPLKDALVFRQFANIDVDKDGFLTLDEFLTAFANRKLSAHATVGAILELAEEKKRANNAALAAREGLIVPVPPVAGSATPKKGANSPQRHTSHSALPVAVCDDDLAEEFCKYDCEGTGLIERKTFSKIYASMEHYGLQPTPEDIDKLLDRFCLSRPGYLTYQEFCLIMLRRSRM